MGPNTVRFAVLYHNEVPNIEDAVFFDDYQDNKTLFYEQVYENFANITNTSKTLKTSHTLPLT